MKQPSNLCSCIYCHEVKSVKGIFTHVDRAHLGKTQYCQGNNGSYDKVAKTKQDKKFNKEQKYLLNPKRCLCCNAILAFDKRNGKFCNSSCSASYSNKNKKDSEETRKKKSIALKGRVFAHIRYETEKCIYCSKEFQTQLIGKNAKLKKFCRDKCKNDYKLAKADNISKYRILAAFRFTCEDYPEEFDLSLVNEIGWYNLSNAGNNLNGVSRDHMVSVKYGHENVIDPNILAHPANCRLVRHNDNMSKGLKNSIALEELLERIQKWDKKYNAS